VEKAFLMPCERNPYPALSAFVSQLLPHCNYHQVCLRQDFARAQAKADNRLATVSSSITNQCRFFFFYGIISHLNLFSDRLLNLYLRKRENNTHWDVGVSDERKGETDRNWKKKGGNCRNNC
jgi:hypothetical protein